MSFDYEENSSPRDLIITGVFLIALALGLYFLLTAHWDPGHFTGAWKGKLLVFLFGMLYFLLGKWGVIGVPALLGLLALFLGINELRDD